MLKWECGNCWKELISEDNFDFLDFDKWEHEIRRHTMGGGGNWEFKWNYWYESDVMKEVELCLFVPRGGDKINVFEKNFEGSDPQKV